MVSQLKTQVPLVLAATAASGLALVAPDKLASVAVIVATLSAWWPGFTAVLFAALLVRPLASVPSGWCPPNWSDVASRAVASALSFGALALVKPRLVAVVIATTILCALVLAVIAHVVNRPRPDDSSSSTPLRGGA